MTVITTKPDVVVVTPGQNPRAIITTPETPINVSIPSGAPGRTGPQGEPGPEGQPGGGIFRGRWIYSNTVTPPPANGTVRTPVDSSEVYLSKFDKDGFDRTSALDSLSTGDVITFKGELGGVTQAMINGPIVDNVTWRLYPVAPTTGEPLDTKKGAEVEIHFTQPLPPGPQGPPGVANIIAVPAADWPPPEPHVPDALYVKVT